MLVALHNTRTAVQQRLPPEVMVICPPPSARYNLADRQHLVIGASGLAIKLLRRTHGALRSGSDLASLLKGSGVGRFANDHADHPIAAAATKQLSGPRVEVVLALAVRRSSFPGHSTRREHTARPVGLALFHGARTRWHRTSVSPRRGRAHLAGEAGAQL
ncbi:hypothetical protein FVE85_4222 [Porphyridium purpureum]|uniref:Uncharacterized protein n=1 Tax=Porphyridium purpureum TaxID=35688 RepID=A0A5J4YV25_PORPP|nr:hypothetical protein FVE85_4222 [Porphyridium purpureum]|eukprot:POR9484..scf229_5